MWLVLGPLFVGENFLISWKLSFGIYLERCDEIIYQASRRFIFVEIYAIPDAFHPDESMLEPKCGDLIITISEIMHMQPV